MLIAEHPASFLPNEILSEIRKHGAEAEVMKTLHPRQLKIIYDQRWFRMFIPLSQGGLQKTLPEVLRIEEALAWADGSTAWVVTLCSGAGWFYGFLRPRVSKQIFSTDNVCIAGSGAPSGTAAIEGDGFRINGTWKYASGALHATMFTANCVIIKDGTPLLNDDGKPIVKAFIVPKHDVTIEENWHSMGMIATASHGFLIRDLYVKAESAFEISPEHVTDSSPVYRYPFLPLAEATLAVNYSGMTQQFLDLCEPIFQTRLNLNPSVADDIIQKYAGAKNKLQGCRSLFYEHVTLSWQGCEDMTITQDELYKNVSKTSYQLYQICFEIMSTLYRYTGLSGANQNNEINRVWRNFHTASQHTLFSLR